MGCFIRGRHGRVGEELEQARILNLRKAVLLAGLDANAELPEEAQGRRLDGGRTLTSDHALVFAHRISVDGYVVANYGMLVETLEGGLNVYRPEEWQIPAPVELSSAHWPRPLDRDYAEAAPSCSAR
jgi:hypothetical protein